MTITIVAAGEFDQLHDLATQLTARAPIEADREAVGKMLALVAKLDSTELAAAADEHSRGRIAALNEVAPGAAGDFSLYLDLMRFPQSSVGAAVRAVGRVERLAEPVEDGRLVWINPSDAPEREIALLLPAGVDPPEAGAEIASTGIFAKRIPVGERETERVAPLIIAPDWRERTVESIRSDFDWSVVRDRTIGVKPEEAELYYEVLGKAAGVKSTTIREEAREFEAARRQAHPTWVIDGEYWMFKDLIEDPEELRGHPITLTGHAREIRSYPAGENEFGIETLYEIWIFTDKSQTNPAVVVASDIPESVPIGDNLQVPLRVTGYFFKLYGYHAASKARIAPMLLAGPVQRLPEPEVTGFPWWFIALIGGGGLLILVAIIMSFRGDRRRIKKPEEESPPDFGGLG